MLCIRIVAGRGGWYPPVCLSRVRMEVRNGFASVCEPMLYCHSREGGNPDVAQPSAVVKDVFPAYAGILIFYIIFLIFYFASGPERATDSLSHCSHLDTFLTFARATEFFLTLCTGDACVALLSHPSCRTGDIYVALSSASPFVRARYIVPSDPRSPARIAPDEIRGIIRFSIPTNPEGHVRQFKARNYLPKKDLAFFFRFSTKVFRFSISHTISSPLAI